MKSDVVNSEAELISKLKTNDSSVMETIYKLYWKSLYQSAFNVLKDKTVCEDIIQELFVKIWERRQDLTINYSIQAYLCACVRYEVYRKIRTVRRFEPIIDEIVNEISCIDYNKVEMQELESRIKSIINTFPPKCKNVYLLSRNNHLAHKEIALKLNISTNTVRNHLTYALKQLRVNLQHYIGML